MTTSYRALFDIPHDVCFLNTAFMGPMPKAAVAAASAAAQAKCQPWTVGIEAFFETADALRAGSSRLFGAPAKDIAIIPSASYGLAAAARNICLEAGQDVIVLDEQFPSNVYIWRELAKKTGAHLRTVARRPGESWTQAVLKAITPATGLVACPQTHWVDGGLIDLVAVREALAPHGGEIVLDLSQSLGVQPIDLARVRPAFAVSVGYKWLMGPYSLSYLYVRPDMQSGEPLEQGWITREGSENFARLADCREPFRGGAERFDMGERSNFQLAPQAMPGLELLGELGPQGAAGIIGGWSAQIAERAEPLGLGADPEGLRSAHYLGMDLPKSAPEDLLARLKAKDVHVSQRGRRLRVTPHVYTTQADVDRFIEVLEVCL